MYRPIVIVLHESESDTELSEVKSELLSLKIASRIHHNTLVQDKNLDPTPSIVAPSALHTPRFRRSVLCVPYFQCRLLAILPNAEQAIGSCTAGKHWHNATAR